jgi:hypothetical protein
VESVERGVVAFAPITRGITWRHASAHEVIGHWRKTRVPGVDDAPVIPKEQLSLGPFDVERD